MNICGVRPAWVEVGYSRQRRYDDTLLPRWLCHFTTYHLGDNPPAPRPFR